MENVRKQDTQVRVRVARTRLDPSPSGSKGPRRALGARVASAKGDCGAGFILCEIAPEAVAQAILRLGDGDTRR